MLSSLSDRDGFAAILELLVRHLICLYIHDMAHFLHINGRFDEFELILFWFLRFVEIYSSGSIKFLCVFLQIGFEVYVLRQNHHVTIFA